MTEAAGQEIPGERDTERGPEHLEKSHDRSNESVDIHDTSNTNRPGSTK